MKKLFFRISPPSLVVFSLVFLFFLPKLIQGKVPIPADALLGLYHPFRDISFDGYSPGRFPVKNPLITDPILQTYPWRKLVIDNFKEHNWPFWNPYSFSGQPLLSNVQSAPFQVLNLLYFIFPFKVAWSMQIILPPMIASLFMFYFLKSLKISSAGSIFGSVILSFSGFFVAWQQWGTVIASAMWSPLIFLCINKLFAKQSYLWFVLLVVAVSQTIFSGHWQMALYVLVASALYLIYLFYRLINLKALVIIFFGISFGILLTSLQTVPSLEFINLSAREIDQGYFQGRQDWFLPLKHLIQLLAPDFFGNPTTYNYWGIWNYAEFVSFIGIIPLGLAIFGIFAKDTRQFFFIILSAVALLFAIENPLSKIPYQLNLPFISSSQPSRIIFLFAFSLAVLAAIGFDKFLKERVNKRTFIPSLALIVVLSSLVVYTLLFQRTFPQMEFNVVRVATRNLAFPLVTTFIFTLLIVIKYLRFPKILLIIVIFAATLVELFRFGYKFSPFSKFSWVFPKTATTDYLVNQEKPFRIMMTDRRILNGNSPSAYKLETVQGYDPLYLADYGDLVGSWNSERLSKGGSFNRIITPQNYDSKIANFLNVKYVLSLDEISKPHFEKVFQEGDTKVYQNDNVLPRAFFVSEVLKVKNKEAELEKLVEPDFDLKNSAVSSEFEFSKRKINGKIIFKEYHDQSFRLETILENEAPLVVSNVFYPGWQAAIDGKRAEIKRVNFMFQSLIVPKGTHQVEFKFKPKSFYNGLYLSITGLVLTTLVGIFLWRIKSL